MVAGLVAAAGDDLVRAMARMPPESLTATPMRRRAEVDRRGPARGLRRCPAGGAARPGRARRRGRPDPCRRPRPARRSCRRRPCTVLGRVGDQLGGVQPAVGGDRRDEADAPAVGGAAEHDGPDAGLVAHGQRPGRAGRRGRGRRPGPRRRRRRPRPTRSPACPAAAWRSSALTSSRSSLISATRRSTASTSSSSATPERRRHLAEPRLVARAAARWARSR